MAERYYIRFRPDPRLPPNDRYFDPDHPDRSGWNETDNEGFYRLVNEVTVLHEHGRGWIHQRVVYHFHGPTAAGYFEGIAVD